MQIVSLVCGPPVGIWTLQAKLVAHALPQFLRANTTMLEHDGSGPVANTDVGHGAGWLHLLLISAVWLQTIHPVLRADSGCEPSANLFRDFAMIRDFSIGHDTTLLCLCAWKDTQKTG